MKKISLITLIIITTAVSIFAQGYRVNRTNEKTKARLRSAGLGKNIISFSPVTVAVNSVMNDGNANLAVGFSYERIFDNEYISFRLPVNFTIEKSGVYLMPTIKFYPKKQGIVKYAVGPQFLISYVDDYMPYYMLTSSQPMYPVRELRRQFGFGLNNSLNFTISKHLYAGMEATLGILYYDSFNDNTNYNNYNDNGVGIDLNQSFSAGFSIGCRF